MTSLLPDPHALICRAERTLRAAESLLTAAPRMLATLDGLESLVDSLNEAMPRVLPVVDQTQILVETVNDAMPRVVSVLDQAEPLVTSANDVMPRVVLTIDQTLALAGSVNESLTRIKSLLEHLEPLLEKATAVADHIEAEYSDSVVGRTGTAVTKARTASHGLRASLHHEHESSGAGGSPEDAQT